MKKTMTTLMTAVVLTLTMAGVVSAEEPRFAPGAKLYIEKMDGGLDGFLRAEIMKKKVPVQLVMSADDADFVMTGAVSERKGSWHEGWLSPEKDKAGGSVTVVSKANELVWAEEAGDRSLMWGSLARSGPRKVASRIADRLKDYLDDVRKQR